MQWCVRALILIAFIGASSNCGSLISELDRIKNKSAGGSSPVNVATAPTVLYTIPADGVLSAAVQSYIDVVFDQPIDSTTVTGPSNGSCSGTAQASYDGFQNCGGTPSVSGNIVRLSASPLMPQAVSLKVQITSGVRGTNGMPANPYQSASGFSFTSPCGQNCFYSDSAPLSAPTGAGSHAFVIPSGPKAGGIIIYASGTSTTYWDPQTNQTATGPINCGGIAVGAHTFYMNTAGYLRSGHMLTPVGGGSSTICDYDPATHTISGGLSIASQTWYGSVTIPILSGGSAGMYLTTKGVNTVGSVPTPTTSIYNPATDSYAGGPNATCNIGGGAQWFRLDTSPNLGKPWLFCGNGGSGTTLLDESTMTFASPASLMGGVNNDSLIFRINAGLYANQLVVGTQGSTSGYFYDQNVTPGLSGTFFTPLFTPGPGVQTANLTSGARNGQTLILRGGSTSEYGFYIHSSNSFSPLFTQTTGVISTDSSITKISTGPHAGKYFIVNGNITGNTSMYDPALDAFSGTRLFKSTGPGVNAFAIKSGPKAGRIMIITGGSAGTTIYNPQAGLAEPGPDLPGAAAAGSISIPVTSGPNTGMQYVFQGGTAIYKYDPSSNAFSTATVGVDYFTAPSGTGASARHLLVTSGPQANNYLILRGGGAPGADYFNTATNTFTTGITVTGCASTNNGSWIFKINSGGQSGKFMIICGTTTTTSLFDPSGASFASGPGLGVAPVTGAHGFYVTSGPQAGKFLLIIATATTTRLYDPTLNSWGVGPALCGTAGAGGFSLPVMAGANSGKTLVVLGGGTTSTCYYDPATHTFATGPVTGGHTGYAVGGDSLAFPTGGGLYPSAYIVIHGALSTVFSHWFSY